MDVSVTLKLTATEFQTLRTELKAREADLMKAFKEASGMEKATLRTALASLQFLIEKLG